MTDKDLGWGEPTGGEFSEQLADAEALRSNPSRQEAQPTLVNPRYANPSGITPTEFKVLIDPDKIEEKVGSILLPESAQQSEKFAQIKGRIVARSPHAFSYASQAEWDAVGAEKPNAGDLVLYAKYAGVRVKGKDGKEYLIVNDKDICAVIED